MLIEIIGDYDRGGYFLVYKGEQPLPFLTFYTGPFPSRADAQRAIPEYTKVIQSALGSESARNEA